MRSAAVLRAWRPPQRCRALRAAGAFPEPVGPPARYTEEAYAVEQARVKRAMAERARGVRAPEVLFEDDWLVAVDKPCGAYHEDVQQAARALLQARAAPRAQECELHAFGRLDRDTSGVLLFSKQPGFQRVRVAQLFKNHDARVLKSYVALCAVTAACTLQPGESAEIETGHGRAHMGLFRLYTREDVGKALPSAHKERRPTVKIMKTRVQRLRGELGPEEDALGLCDFDPTFAWAGVADAPAARRVTLVNAEPITGRTHQIRMHLAHRGLPLVGDVRYGGPLLRSSARDCHLLHARSLVLPAAREDDPDLTIVAPLPDWALQLSTRQQTVDCSSKR